MRAEFCRRIPGISICLAIRPQPIWPIWIFLLGASAPRADEGMMVGIRDAPAAPAREVLRNCRRERWRCLFIIYYRLVDGMTCGDVHLLSPIAQRMPPRRCLVNCGSA